MADNMGARQAYKRTGAVPSTGDTGAGSKVTTPKAYKKGGSVKPSTSKTYSRGGKSRC